MKIDVYSVMLNEARLLPYWLRHYEQFASAIFVWDGGSTDGTRELLRRHPLVSMYDQEVKGLDDHYFTTCFMRYRDFSRGHADWCMAVAADEFIYHPDLKQRLSIIDRNKVQLRGFTMYAPQFPTTTGQIYDEVRYGYPDIWSTKTVLFRPQHDMQWEPGLHREVSPGQAVRFTGIKLLHYRYLGADWYVERTRRNYAQWRVAGIEVEFDPDRTHNLPDGTRGNPYQWYEANVHKLEEVVMAESKEYIVKTTSSRELRLKKLADNNYQIKLHWGRGDKTLATLVLPPGEWAKLANYSEGLKRK